MWCKSVVLDFLKNEFGDDIIMVPEATPNAEIAADALNSAPLMPAAPADTTVEPAMPLSPAMPDPTAPAVADPAPVVDSAAPADPNAGQTGQL